MNGIKVKIQNFTVQLFDENDHQLDNVTALDMHLEAGVMPKLQLTMIVPASVIEVEDLPIELRFDQADLKRLVEAHGYALVAEEKDPTTIDCHVEEDLGPDEDQD